MIYVWKCLPDPGLEFLKVSGPDGCEFGDIRLPPTLWSCLEHRFTQRYQIFGAICFDQQHDQSISIIRSSQLLQVSSVTPSEALPWNPRCDSIFRPQIGQWVSPTILCSWRNRDLGFCRYERNKKSSTNSRKCLSAVVVALFTADAGQVPWPPMIRSCFWCSSEIMGEPLPRQKPGLKKREKRQDLTKVTEVS